MNEMTLPYRHRILNLGGRVRYLSITEAPHNIEYLRVSKKETFFSLKLECQSGVRTRDLRLSKQSALTTAPYQGPALSVAYGI